MTYHQKFTVRHDVSETVYKSVNGHDIKAYVLVPKNAPSGKLPIAVRFHGGFLIFGHAMFPDWYPQWYLDYTEFHNAIIINANYRLLPGVDGLGILSDVRDFFSWIRNSLNGYLDRVSPGKQADLDHVLVAGESAGGYLAIQSALLEGDFVKAVISGYPVLDYDSEFFTTNIPKNIMGAPMMPVERVNQILAGIKDAPVTSEVRDPSYMAVMIATIQQGRIGEFLGTDEIVYPMKTVVKAEKLPMIFIMHGIQDSAVPVAGTEKFVEIAGSKFKDSLHVEYQPGDHGFDTETKVDADWMKRGLDKITKAWLA